MNRTQGSLLQEMLEDLVIKKDELEHELKTANGVDAQGLLDQIALIDKAINDPKALTEVQDGVDAPMVTGDPVVDQWERDIFAGRMPDFSGGPAPRQRK